MYCRSRPQYRSDLGWISGVAFLGTLTRSARPVQGFTCVRCCSMPPASSHTASRRQGLGVSRRRSLHAVAFSSRLLPTRSAEDFHLQSSAHAWHTKPRALGAPRCGFGALTARRVRAAMSSCDADQHRGRVTEEKRKAASLLKIFRQATSRSSWYRNPQMSLQKECK